MAALPSKEKCRSTNGCTRARLVAKYRATPSATA
jgi:hypothetical protein